MLVEPWVQEPWAWLDDESTMTMMNLTNCRLDDNADQCKNNNVFRITTAMAVTATMVTTKVHVCRRESLAKRPAEEIWSNVENINGSDRQQWPWALEEMVVTTNSWRCR